MDITSLTSQNTPAEILPLMRQCVLANDYDRAARLFAAADTYGRFDTFRVNDTSAHAVIPALESASMQSLDKNSYAKLMAVVTEISGSPGQLSHLCDQLRSLGAPSYYPKYMLLHGLSAFTGQGGGLKHDFDRNAAWEAALKAVMECPSR